MKANAIEYRPRHAAARRSHSLSVESLRERDERDRDLAWRLLLAQREGEQLWNAMRIAAWLAEQRGRAVLGDDMYQRIHGLGNQDAAA